MSCIFINVSLYLERTIITFLLPTFEVFSANMSCFKLSKLKYKPYKKIVTPYSAPLQLKFENTGISSFITEKNLYRF